MTCKTCGAQGFEPSILPDMCQFCDGTFGGHPVPTEGTVTGRFSHSPPEYQHLKFGGNQIPKSPQPNMVEIDFSRIEKRVLAAMTPISENPPNPDCGHCGGEGVKTFQQRMFDYDLADACKHCWENDDGQ